MKMFEAKVESLVPYDRVLVEKMGYVAEHYGKWHLPPPLYKGTRGKGDIISNDDYDYVSEKPRLTQKETRKIYKRRLKEVLKIIGIKRKGKFRSGQQKDSYTGFPYDPSRLDVRYEMPKGTSIRGDKGDLMGVGTIPNAATPTAMIGDMAIMALDRLGNTTEGTKDPFCLTVSFNCPHPPMIPTKSYAKIYNTRRDSLYVSESAGDNMTGNAYEKDTLVEEGYSNDFNIREWTALYYGLIEEGTQFYLFLKHSAYIGD
jgi:hypothetical protein